MNYWTRIKGTIGTINNQCLLWKIFLQTIPCHCWWWFTKCPTIKWNRMYIIINNTFIPMKNEENPWIPSYFDSLQSINIFKTMIFDYQRIKKQFEKKWIHIIPSPIPNNNNVFFNVIVDTDLQPESMNCWPTSPNWNHENWSTYYEHPKMIIIITETLIMTNTKKRNLILNTNSRSRQYQSIHTPSSSFHFHDVCLSK